MKTYYEMADSVFRRMEAYENTRKHRQRRMLRTAAVCCCLCLAVLAGLGLHAQGTWRPAPPAGSLSAASNRGDNTAQLVIQPLQHISVGKDETDEICLMLADAVPLSAQQLEAYMGTPVFPEVPSDFGAEQSQLQGISYRIFRRDGGAGEVYYDRQLLHYTNDSHTREIHMEIRKGAMSPFCDVTWDKTQGTSTLSGCAVFIGQTPDGTYLAEFMHQNVGFRIILSGVTQTEMTEIISSLLV